MDTNQDDADAADDGPTLDECLASEELRFNVQTVINLLETKRTEQLSDRVRFEFDMTAIAMLAALRRCYSSKSN